MNWLPQDPRDEREEKGRAAERKRVSLMWDLVRESNRRSGEIIRGTGEPISEMERARESLSHIE